MHEGGNPQSTSQALSVPIYVRKKPLNTERRIQWTRARMMRKFTDVQLGILFSTWNLVLGWGSGGKYLRQWEDVVLIFGCFPEVRWKGKGAKVIGNSFKFLRNECFKAENGVDVLVANWLLGSLWGLRGLMLEWWWSILLLRMKFGR